MWHTIEVTYSSEQERRTLILELSLMEVQGKLQYAISSKHITVYFYKS